MKFSIITPTYNSEKYLSKTIESVLSQNGDFEIEYIMIDGGSTDSTINIANEYKSKLDTGNIKIFCKKISIRFISEKDSGVYDAINKGFNIATGDIFAWLGSDDIYNPNSAFSEIETWFTKHPESNWVKGMCGLIDVNGITTNNTIRRTYYQDWLAQGIYGRETYFLEQESVFWRQELWKKVAPIPKNLKSAGDYWLWIQFAKYSPLDSIPKQVSNFRIRPGQISSDIARYKKEQYDILPNRSRTAIKVRIFSVLWNHLQFIKPVLKIIHPFIFKGKRLNIN